MDSVNPLDATAVHPESYEATKKLLEKLDISIEAIEADKLKKLTKDDKTKLAEEIGCAVQTVYRWEKGERIPDLPTLMQIAKVLGVRIEDLIQ